MEYFDFLGDKASKKAKKASKRLASDILDLYIQRGVKNEFVRESVKNLVYIDTLRRLDELLFGENPNGRETGTYKADLAGGLIDRIRQNQDPDFRDNFPFIKTNILADVYNLTEAIQPFLESRIEILSDFVDIFRETFEYPLYYSIATQNILNDSQTNPTQEIRDFLEKSCKFLVYEEDE